MEKSKAGYYVRHILKSGDYFEIKIIWPSKPILSKEIDTIKQRVMASAKNNELISFRVVFIEKDEAGDIMKVVHLYKK